MVNTAIAKSLLEGVEAGTPIDVYLITGQSNTDDRADFKMLPQVQQQSLRKQPDVLFYHGATEPRRDASANQWIALQPGSGTNFEINHTPDTRQLNFGPEVGLGQALLERQSPGRIAILKATQGGTSLAVDWAPGKGRIWKMFRRTVDRGLKSLGDAGYQPRIVGMIWAQGEKDSKDPQMAQDYEAHLTEFFTAVRSVYGEMLPILVTSINVFDAADQKIFDAQQAVTANDPYAVFVSTDDLTFKDGVHYDAASQLVLGARCAAVLGGDSMKQVTIKPTAWTSQARRMLSTDEGQLARLTLGNSDNLIEMAPVNLPGHGAGDCNHFGWPIATMVDQTLVVMHRRIPGHNRVGAGGPDESMSYGNVLRSDDGGKSWSQPYDLRDCMKPEDRNRGGIVPLSHRSKFDLDNHSPLGYKVHLHAIGTMRDGAVMAINNHGVFRSEDKGRTWKHFSTALRDDTFPHMIVNLGPRIFDDPKMGIVAFGNWTGTWADKKLYKQLVVLQSPDDGESWKATEYPVKVAQYEPAALFYDDEYLFVTRDQSNINNKPMHKQMSWQQGQSPQVSDTNMVAPRLIDTVDLSLNPITGRFEVLRSERDKMELWIWSLAPEDWGTGKWRRECRLFKRDGKFYQNADGFHPAGAVIDAVRGVQHIFIYCGHPNGPAGVFRITRSLDTPRLAAYLNAQPVK